MRSRAKLYLFLGIAGVIPLALGAGFLVHVLGASPRSRLPRGATSIHEKQVDFGNDYIYYLKATMSPSDAAAFIASAGFPIHTPTRAYADDTMWLSWRGEIDGIPWWDPGEDVSSTYVGQEKHSWILIKYEKGNLYYKAIAH